MPKITLRTAREADANAMLQIYTPYVTSTRASWEYEPPGPAVFAERVREHLAAGFPWLLAEEGGTNHAGGTVLGYAYAGRLGERRGYDWDAEATVYLRADAHRLHIGTALYTALLALLRAQGYVNCYALITDPNPASEVFHRRMGFAEAARLPGAGYKHGQWIGLFYYHKLLCAPPAHPAPPVPLCALDEKQVAEILEDAAQLCAGAWSDQASAPGKDFAPSAPVCADAGHTPRENDCLKNGDTESLQTTWPCTEAGCTPQPCAEADCAPQRCAETGCAPQPCPEAGCAPQRCAETGCTP